MSMVFRVENGLRLSRPEICPQNVYTLMQCCWSGNANLRPDFQEIINWLVDCGTQILQFQIHVN
ncbi:protein-tyrosine kinase 2-beta-like protein [Leptotrombidium deliense]|uniref:Protein-tyrosine kinase 2-beta-like protein n=1 Tax=Leptotrombidium deliense TaxID=299467 RepID=A0A443RYG0_9ACAR|nr:protein-tyrosine kinase 2-beta-like protein [Leptotrombidium deliense]